MTTLYQASFTPTDESADNIMIVKNQGSLNTVPYYRKTEDQGLDGNYNIKLGSKSIEFESIIVVEFATEALLIADQNKVGVLKIRGATHNNVRLLTAERVRLLDTSSSIVSGILTVSGTYSEMRVVFCKEAQ